MTKEPTATLYVNLSASQTRKRLKHQGLGVKQIEAIDRKQSAITHTATGEHLRRLRAVFDDVVVSTSRSEADVPVENLKNIGAGIGLRLGEIGIRTRAELAACGPIRAFQLIRQTAPDDTNPSLLWSLAAALAGWEREGFPVRWPIGGLSAGVDLFASRQPLLFRPGVRPSGSCQERSGGHGQTAHSAR